MVIRAVVFDLGHTLWDITRQDQALAQAYAEMRAVLVERLGRDDLPEAPAFQRAVRDVLVEASQTYFSDGPDLDQPASTLWVDRGCRKLGVALDADLLEAITPALFATERDGLICGEGTLDAVRDLHDAGYALGCITNTLANTATIRSMLERHGFAGMMRSVVVSADEGWRKPHLSLFEKSLRELGVEAAETVFVGDSPAHDVAGAKAAGMRAVLTRQYVARPYDGAAPQPDAVIEHLRELPAVIRRFDAVDV